MIGEAERSIVPAGVRGLGTVEQVEQVESESAVVDEGGTVGRRTGARDGGAGGAGRAKAGWLGRSSLSRTAE
jgi:hypothetical protein